MGEYGEGGARLVLREMKGALEVGSDGGIFEAVRELGGDRYVAQHLGEFRVDRGVSAAGTKAAPNASLPIVNVEFEATSNIPRAPAQELCRERVDGSRLTRDSGVDELDRLVDLAIFQRLSRLGNGLHHRAAIAHVDVFPTNRTV